MHSALFNLLNLCFVLRIKIIRKECEKRWPGNNKIYFRSNNSNSLVSSEMCSSLLPLCEIKAIGFGESKDKYFVSMTLRKDMRMT